MALSKHMRANSGPGDNMKTKVETNYSNQRREDTQNSGKKHFNLAKSAVLNQPSLQEQQPLYMSNAFRKNLQSGKGSRK